MWRAGSWHCEGCGYANYRENVGCRKCGVGREGEGRERGETSSRRRERSEKGEKDRRSERLTRRKLSRSCDKKGESHVGDKLGRRKPTWDKLEDKVIEEKKVSSGSGKKRELESSSPQISSRKLSIISPVGCIKRLEKLSDGNTPLWVKTFPDIVEYFGKFGTISDVREENNGISRITFYEKSSAVKALSSSHKQFITFYEEASKVAGHHDVDRHGEPEDSRVKALKNYEADVNSFLFGTEELQGTSKAARSGNIKKVNRDSNSLKDYISEKKDSANVYSRIASKKPKFHIPRGKIFGVEADMKFVKEAENNKWRIAVEKFESMKDGAHVKFNDNFDVEEREDAVGGGAIKIKTTFKSARVPNILERKLLAMAGSYEDPGSGSGKVVLRSRNSDDNTTELVDIADSDEEVVEVVKNENDYQSKLIRLEKASGKEKEVILKSMGIISRDSEPLVVEERELVDLSDSVSKDTNLLVIEAREFVDLSEPPVVKARELLNISDSDSVNIGIVPPVVEARELVDLSGSKEADPPVVEARELVDLSASVGKDTNLLVIEAREFVDLSDSDTGLFSDGSEGMR